MQKGTVKSKFKVNKSAFFRQKILCKQILVVCNYDHINVSKFDVTVVEVKGLAL